MIHQLSMNFETGASSNLLNLSGQNKRLYEYLLTGRSIHCMHEDISSIHIGYLNSRISDLINKHRIPIFKRTIKVKDAFGQLVDVKEYSLKPFDNA